jgi:hypothetical protein
MQEMTVRDELHQLADTLQEPAAVALLDYARWLAVHQGETLTKAERVHGSEPTTARRQGDGLEDLLHELLGDGPGAESPTEA